MTREAPQRRPREERRTEIADAALRIVATRGIASLTLATLAAELGITAAALFRHFRSRDEILEAVAARAEARVATTFPPETLPPLERLQALMQARTRTVGGDVGLARLLFSEQFSLALPARAAARLRGIVRRTRAFVTAALEEAARDGALRRDVSPAALAPIVMGTIQALTFFSAGGAVRAHEAPPARVWAALETLLAPPRPPRRRSARTRTRSRGGSR